MTSTGDGDYFKRVSELLGLSLMTAVPLRIFEAKGLPPSIQRLSLDTWASEAAERIAFNGDMLMFRTKPETVHKQSCEESMRQNCGCPKVGTADVFNALAKGVASGSFQPGGICTFGLQFCAKHLAGGKEVGNQHSVCLYCTQEEEIVALGHESLLERFWRQLDIHVDEVQRLLHGEDSGLTGREHLVAVSKARGRADNAALFIALLADPYNPDTDKVRKEAMRRWRKRQRADKVKRGQIETVKTGDRL